jgi:Flp pilus assembly protein TadD
MDDAQRKDAERWAAVEEATELMVEGSYHDALLILRDVIKQDPRNHYAYHYTGTALFEIGQFEGAATAFRAAIRLAPRHIGARVGLSHALRIIDETRAAVAEARKALELAPGDGDALHALGLALAATGDKAGARRALLAFLDTRPEFEAAAEAQAMLDRLQTPGDDDEGENDAS